MMIPPFLSSGDTIGIVAPARKVTRDEMKPAIQLLQSWGLQVKEGKFLYENHHQFSGTDKQRAEDLSDMLKDPEVKAIIAARGGYGAVRMIDLIPGSTFTENPKWFCGFSDMTVIHAHLHQLGVASIHSPMMSTLLRDKDSAECLRKALFGETMHYHFEPHPFNREGRAEARITGGNLSLIYALSGSVSDAELSGRILFLEDLDEYVYHIDRMMWQLKRSGKLKNLQGLIVGGFSDMKDHDTPFGMDAYQIISEAVSSYSYPVCFGFPSGHETVNKALYFGMQADLQVGNDHGSLRFPFLRA